MRQVGLAVAFSGVLFPQIKENLRFANFLPYKAKSRNRKKYAILAYSGPDLRESGAKKEKAQEILDRAEGSAIFPHLRLHVAHFLHF